MYDQATIDPPKQKAATSTDVSGNLSGILHDLTELSELQTRLFIADVREMWSGSQRSLVGVVTAVVLALSSVPVLLMGIAYALTQLSIPMWIAFVAVPVVLGIVPAAIIVWFSLSHMRSALGTLERSTSEFSRNLQWLKATLKRGSK